METRTAERVLPTPANAVPPSPSPSPSPSPAQPSGRTLFSPIFLPPPLEGFPPVHRSDPMALTRNIHPGQLQDWLNNTQSTCAALQIYGVGYPSVDRAEAITSGLRAALVAITGCYAVEVAAPIAARDEHDELLFPLPATYFAYGLTEEAATRLKAQICWSTSAISFFAYDLAPVIPNFLFTLHGFTKGDEKALEETVRRTFLVTRFCRFTASFAVNNPRFRGYSTDRIIETLMRTLEVKVVRVPGTTLQAVNVHCASPTTSPELWCLWRDALGAAQYVHSLCREGFPKRGLTCSGCHGNDHVRKGCPFAMLLGWNSSHELQE
ncbi:hypothetical protein GY45DRAFT_1264669 [Cubamyces sp. BRFM 1775]|nr:hypothetical protein GY45DRAFT_1264669 [Cubamyces sp. BRFM 1775]